MKMKLDYLFLLFLTLVFLISCRGNAGNQGELGSFYRGRSVEAALTLTDGEADKTELLRLLDELAELERSGQWIQGMGLTESGIRENAGDFAGAIVSAYKEFSMAYGMGLIQKADIENGLRAVLDTNSEDSVFLAVNAVLAFLKEQWDEAASILELLLVYCDEPDSFGRWMKLVCTLEIAIRDKSKNIPADELALREERRLSSAYRSIRARYAPFPEFWYRGARAFSGAIAADYAENCINLSPQGPFADECRKILASFAGLRIEDSLSIKTKREIESIITMSVNSENPQILEALMPLIGLPENPYTVYAVNTLRSLIGVRGFRDYFNRKAAASSGRLAERLLYICRG